MDTSVGTPAWRVAAVAEKHVERAVGIGVAGVPAGRHAEPLHGRPAAPFEHAIERGLRAVAHDQSVARHRAHEVMELGLDCGEVGEDVRVVELQIVQDRGARPVVNELRALVEERRVVLVRLDGEERRVGEPRRDAEVHRHAADEEAGIELRVLEDPRRHGTGRRLAVRARDCKHPFATQHVLREPLRTRHVGQSQFEDALHERVAARHHVADDEQVGRERDLSRVPALRERDALRLQLGTHRGIDVRVATGHAVARLLGDHRDTAHEGAADAEDVDVHERRRKG